MREDFLRIYANLPIGIRDSIIYVDDKYGACTWNVVWLEVKADTEIGKKALQTLRELQII